jgi:hypothetical protein
MKTVMVSDKQLQKDSISRKETTRLDTFRVPRSVSVLQLPKDALQVNSVQERTTGRAKVIVRVERDTLYAEAICDSLEHIIQTKDLEIYHYRSLLNEHATDSIETKTFVPFLFKLLMAISVILNIILFTYSILKRFNIL